MDRILILGRSGSGKSHLASMLSQKLNLPVFHLDKLFWLPGWIERSKAEMAIDVEKILNEHPKWVIDGNYKKAALELRIRLSDQIVILDYSFFTCVWRVIKRNIKYRNTIRPDMQDDCPERLNIEFVNYIWSYPKRTLLPILEVLKKFPDKKILRFKNQKELDGWVKYL